MKVNFKKRLLLALLVVLVLAIAVILINKKTHLDLLSLRLSNTLEKADSEPLLAVFTFDSLNQNKLLKSSHHYKLKLSRSKKINFDKNLINNWKKDNNPLVITVETWGINPVNSYNENEMIPMVSGKYDIAIKQLCQDLIGKRQNVYIRFNPEVEVPYKIYPWQGYLHDYTNAFGHLKRLCNKYAPQVKLLWGPSGYPGVLEYYPGDDLVDAASIILKSNSEINLDVYPKNYSLEYDLIRRVHRLRFINKPIFVFGSNHSSNDSINQNLINSVTNHIASNRLIAYSRENFKRPKPQQTTGFQRKFEIGLYDPNDLLNDNKEVTVEHLFADFSNIHDGYFKKSFDKVIERGHDVIVTLEPFRNRDQTEDLQVLQNVIAGKYDLELSLFYDIILNTNRKVYLRYAHEMEIPITRYLWQSQDPVDYIKSFRYFMDFKSPLPANIKRVWGPAGDRGSIEWYPGNDYVDFISIAIYGLPDKNITDPNKQESFKTIFDRKFWRFRFIDKPIFITEFGVKGPEEYQTKWLEDAAKVLRQHPEVIGVNYFNMTDTPKAWGNIKPPDWSISKNSFDHFVTTLNQEIQ